jgi:hypothetical protein
LAGEDAAEAERVEEADCIAGVSVDAQSGWDPDVRILSVIKGVGNFDSPRLESKPPGSLADLSW